jgi:peptidoglycan/LPS O-acetylase OafA/YrhL
MTMLFNTLRKLASPPVRQEGAYFHWLDLVRGCAALAILVWHYQHFYYQTAGINPIVYSREVQPFHDLLALFYHHGYFAVQLFWVISGFVFASVYAGTAPSGREFFVNRFARLYPLHFATLIMVAILQATSFHLQNEFQIYVNNDIYHFILNLFFVSHWGFDAGDSFNAPIWSVSVEIFIYIVFWLTLKQIFRAGILGPLFMAALFLVLMMLKVPGPFWECGIYFYMGCATYVWLVNFRESNAVNSLLGAGAAALGGFLMASDIPHTGDVGRIALFSGMVLLATSCDVWDKARRGARFAWLGNITYSLYLLHVPVQISLILIMDQSGIDRGIAASRGFFLFFIALMLVVATLSYRYFELPTRRWVRRQFKKPDAPRVWAATEPGKEQAR